MTIIQDIRYKKVELLIKNKTSVDRLEYEDCWMKLHYNYLLIQTYNGTGNSFTTKLYPLDTISAIKTDHNTK